MSKIMKLIKSLAAKQILLIKSQNLLPDKTIDGITFASVNFVEKCTAHLFILIQCFFTLLTLISWILTYFCQKYCKNLYPI